MYADINPAKSDEYIVEVSQTPKLVTKKKTIGEAKATLNTLINFLSIT